MESEGSETQHKHLPAASCQHPVLRFAKGDNTLSKGTSISGHFKDLKVKQRFGHFSLGAMRSLSDRKVSSLIRDHGQVHSYQHGHVDKRVSLILKFVNRNLYVLV